MFEETQKKCQPNNFYLATIKRTYSFPYFSVIILFITSILSIFIAIYTQFIISVIGAILFSLFTIFLTHKLIYVFKNTQKEKKFNYIITTDKIQLTDLTDIEDIKTQLNSQINILSMNSELEISKFSIK